MNHHVHVYIQNSHLQLLLKEKKRNQTFVLYHKMGYIRLDMLPSDICSYNILEKMMFHIFSTSIEMPLIL